MIRILNVLGGFHYGGAEGLLVNVFHYIDREKYQMDFLLRNRKNREDILKEIKKNGGKVYVLECRNLPFLSTIEEKAFFKKHGNEYDIIHLHANTAFYGKTLYYAAKFGISVRIMHSHNSSGKSCLRAWIHNRRRKIVEQYATVRIACSKVAGEWMFANKDYIVLENGIELKKFRYVKEERNFFRRKYELNEDLVIGTVGRIVREKNHVFLVQLLKELLKAGIKTKIVIIGSASDRYADSLMKYIEESGLAKEVIFTGAVDYVYRLLNMLDIFALPSFYEGLPIALIEAQANGLPCLVSDKVSVQSVFHSNVHMLSIENGIDDWVNKIKNVSLDMQRIEVKESLYESVYSIETTVKNIEKIYDIGAKNHGKQSEV